MAIVQTTTYTGTGGDTVVHEIHDGNLGGALAHLLKVNAVTGDLVPMSQMASATDARTYGAFGAEHPIRAQQQLVSVPFQIVATTP